MPLISPGNLGDNTPPHGKRSSVLKRYVKLENDRSSWRNHWMEISDYTLPRRGRFLFQTQDDRGKKRTGKIIDNTGTMAVRTLAAGMMSGMTNPARPWFRFAVQNEELMDNHQVKTWLSDVERIVRASFRSLTSTIASSPYTLSWGHSARGHCIVSAWAETA